MNKKNIVLLFLLLLLTNLNMRSADMDFGVFQYKGSRLKEIRRWYENELVDGMRYTYDKKGYLTGRKWFGYRNGRESKTAYESKIKYDLEKSNIYEDFYRPINGVNIPAILEYSYNDKKQLINYKRKDGNMNNNKIRVTSDVDVKYNEKGDIIYVGDKLKVSAYQLYFPGSCLTFSKEATFLYEYKENIKIRLEDLGDNFIRVDSDFIFENNRLVKIIKYGNKKKNDILQIVELKYDEKGNIIETNTMHYGFLTKEQKSIYEDSDITKYEYDDRNRLVKRIEYYNDSIAKNKIYQIEEYFYEDGEYIHYPYLLPSTKILIYNKAETVTIDKFIF